MVEREENRRGDPLNAWGEKRARRRDRSRRTRGLRSTGDPFDLLKHEYRDQFRAAFDAAIGELSPRDRTLLAQYFVDGLTIDELAAIHGSHRATAARWIAKLRETVCASTARQLRAALDVDAEELESILRLIDSQLEASLGALVADS